MKCSNLHVALRSIAQKANVCGSVVKFIVNLWALLTFPLCLRVRIPLSALLGALSCKFVPGIPEMHFLIPELLDKQLVIVSLSEGS